MVRSLALLVAVALATALSACCPEDPFVPTRIIDTTIKNPAYLRIVHAAADAPAAAAMLGGAPFREALPYLTYADRINEAKYYPADTSWKSIGFLGGGSMLATSPIVMEAGAYYTAYLHGRAGVYRVLITRDTVEAPGSLDQVKFRVVNLAPDSPPFDMILSTSPDEPVARNLFYGNASDYSVRGSRDLNSPGVLVVRSGTRDTLMEYLPGLIPLIPGQTFTLVISGFVEPSADQPLLSFSAFLESARDDRSGLYGSLPIRLSLTAIRLINLVPTVSWEGLDLAFYDREYDAKFDGVNQGYRRNYPGQFRLKNVPTLVYPDHETKGYFLQSARNTAWKYRVERSSRDITDPYDQVPISAPDSLYTSLNQRFTVVVFGPDTNLRVGTAELNDDVPAPSLAQTRLRFFHGAHGALAGTRLRLRIGGAESPRMAYGQAPTKEQAIDASSGAVTLEVVDESGTVVASSTHTLEGGFAYTVFVAPKPDGSGLIIRPIADRMKR